LSVLNSKRTLWTKFRRFDAAILVMGGIWSILTEAEIRKAETEERIRYGERIKKLREKESAVKKTLGHLFEARDEGWDDLKEGVGSAWNTLKSSFKEAKSEFERGLKEGMEKENGKDQE
jgi:ABC-type Na+ efflux pump permease subunit